MQRIAVIGLGIMGGGIARNLLKAGYPLTVYNRTKEKSHNLIEAGATWAPSPGEAARDADIVICVVGDDAASRGIWLGDGSTSSPGALAAMKPGAIALECTTLSVGWVRELAALVQARGVRFVDAPMAGSKVAAAAGQLTLYVGAAPELFEELKPVLTTFATTVIHFGPTGAGAMYKLINNMVAATHATALAEGIAMAEKAGLDMEIVLKTITSGAVASPIVKMKAQQVVARNHSDTNFALRWMHKDLTYALRVADELGVPLPTAALAHELYRMAMQMGYADHDFAAVSEVVRGD
jgi:3-hydroxyisobutyrate dehydrogenase